MLSPGSPRSPRRNQYTNGTGRASAKDGSASPGGVQYARPLEPDQALEEAQAVLDAVGGAHYLDGFNLLGVIANPRGNNSVTTTSTYHGRYNQSPGSANPSAHGASSIGSNSHSHTPSFVTNSAIPGNMLFLSSGNEATDQFLSETYQSIESTVSQVTEQMEVMNQVLESWSRQILEDEDWTSDELPSSQLTELPADLQDLDLAPLQSYLERSGVVAHNFHANARIQQGEISQLTSSAAATAPERQHSDVSQSTVGEEIPDIFFDENFDLTNQITFQRLLLGNGEDLDLQPAVDFSDTSGPVDSWFRLPPPDTFGGFLDKVELALLHQVRSKSGAFFAESKRFAQLQQWIQELLEQVVDMKERASQLRKDLLDPLQAIPIADDQRKDLQQLLTVLDRADDMLRCKSSLGGVLSAQDDLNAIEQIRYGRTLLAGKVPADEEEEGAPPIELSRLNALKAVADQLNQYEKLVVTNLRDELVEIFLGWNTASVSSVYGMHGMSTNNRSQQQVRDRVKEIVQALESCNGLVETREAYSHRLQDVIRMTVRTTVGEFASDSSEESSPTSAAVASISTGATGMSLQRFLDCLDMLFEQLLALLTSASGVDELCRVEGIIFDATETLTPMKSVVASAAELSSKSISELLRQRKEAHSLLTLEEMKSVWDACMSFTQHIENMSGSGQSSALRSTLLAQAKAFVERKHESHMSALVAALDSERWSQSEVSAERQNAMTRLCTGRTALVHSGNSAQNETDRKSDLEVEGVRYKVVWSCLLLMEMIITDICSAAQFSSLASGLVGKVGELLRLFNNRATKLVLGAGAIHSNARLKSINAKHLSMVTQCLGMVMAVLPHVRAALMAHMPKKQHTLLTGLDQIKKEFVEHNEKVLNKFVTIIGGIVEHSLAPKIPGTDFEARVSAAPEEAVTCCVFLEGISTNTRKMHQVLKTLLPPQHLIDVFARIFAFVDRKIPVLLVTASEATPPFVFPTTDAGKRRLLAEVDLLTETLNGLEGVQPWDFTAVSVLERRLEIRLHPEASVVHSGTDNGAENGGKSDSENGTATEVANSPTNEEPATQEDQAEEEQPVLPEPIAEPEIIAHDATAQEETKDVSVVPENESSPTVNATVSTNGDLPPPSLEEKEA